MTNRTLVVIVLALIFGTTAAVGSRLLRGAKQRPTLQTTPVVVATADISRGQQLTEEDVELRAWPVQYLPNDPMVSIEDCVQLSAVVPMTAGEPVCGGKLGSAGGRGLAGLIPTGYRAYTIQTSRDASNVAGFVLPGNRVDVLLTLRGGSSQDDTGGGSAVTLLQAVEILAVAQRLDVPIENKIDPQEMRSVTLLVTPEQATLLDLGQNMGHLTLSLRNPTDLAEATPPPATVNTLRYLQRGPQPYDGPTFASLATRAVEALKAARNKQAAESPQPESEDGPRTARIRTLRGRHGGQVLVKIRD